MIKLRPDEIKTGMNVIYFNHKNIRDDGESSNTITPHKRYDAIVDSIHEHITVLLIKDREFDSVPYRWSIRNLDIGKSEHLYVEKGEN